MVLSGCPLPIDLMWEQPLVVRVLNRLSSFCRQIWVDPPGVGASTRDAPFGYGPTLEALTAVLEAEKVTDVILVACGTTGPRAAFFAAAHPDLVRALVFLNSAARTVQDNDYPWGFDGAGIEARIVRGTQRFGTGASLESLAPSLAGNAEVMRWWARCERLYLSPDRWPSILRVAWSSDAREVLPMIHVPTLVIHRQDSATAAGHGRYLAQHIAGASYVEVPGVDDLFFAGDTDPILDALQEFVTGERPQVVADRVLATVLFTDMVASTERATTLGDLAWRDLLGRHRLLVREQLHRFRGREVNTRGDDFLATFDSPARAIRCALALRDAANTLGVEVRSGLHVGRSS
jgi:pimeloyl-ACP methyl ester carboxylesterase